MIVHYEPSLWKEYYPHAKYNPVCIEWHKCTLKGQIVCINYRSRPVHDISLRKRSKMFVVTMQLQFNRDLNSDLR
jgi:predicted metal-binding protein